MSRSKGCRRVFDHKAVLARGHPKPYIYTYFKGSEQKHLHSFTYPILKPGKGGNSIRRNRAFIHVLALYVASSLFMADRYPRVLVDEPWEPMTACALEGRDGYREYFLQLRRLLNLVAAPFFAVFGVVAVRERLVSIFVEALLSGGYIFGRKSLSRRTGLPIARCLWTETMILISARKIRPEIYLAAIQLFSVYFFFSAPWPGSLKKHLYPGPLLDVALWTHPNTLLSYRYRPLRRLPG